jgi:hypothetical protein
MSTGISVELSKSILTDLGYDQETVDLVVLRARKLMRRRAWIWGGFAVGSGICACGLSILGTSAGYYLAHPGGYYVAYVGIFLAGVLTIIRGAYIIAHFEFKESYRKESSAISHT